MTRSTTKTTYTGSLPAIDPIARAIKSGYVPTLRDWRKADPRTWSVGERICAFIENRVLIPEGPKVGQPMHLLPFQAAFILAIFDGKKRARRAILSIGRKGGKTALIAAILLACMWIEHLVSRNSRMNSAALSREQAALVFNYMAKSIALSPTLSAMMKITPSNKTIFCVRTGIEYHALAAEAGTIMGLSPVVCVGDEWGQIVGPVHPFVDALLTSQGAHDEPLAIVISTQAASDADLLSVMIDDAIRNPSDDVVCHLYTADVDLDIEDPRAWVQACPALGEFRSADDVRMQAGQAKRLPVHQASFKNLILNQRVAREHLWLAPSVWKGGNALPDMAVFRQGPCTMGLDLSQRLDLTAAVLCARDDQGLLHLLPFVFSPETGLRERELRDRAPYTTWADQGLLVTCPGASLDYEWVFGWLQNMLERENIQVDLVAFDRWRIKEARRAAESVGFWAMDWQEIGQGYKDMSPRVEHFETMLLQGKLKHGGHPLLNMAAANCIVVADPAGNRKPEKAKSSQRIDPLVAAIMAVGCFMTQPEAYDVKAWIG